MPVYPAFAVYSKVDWLSCSSLPCSGFCIMLELAIAPSILRGKRQAPPDATSKTPVELMPQVESVPATGHSEAACADETGTKLGAARTIPKAIAFDMRTKSPSLFSTVRGFRLRGATLIWILHIRCPWIVDRHGRNPDRWIYRCACMEGVEVVFARRSSPNAGSQTPKHQGRQRAADPLIGSGWLVGCLDEQVLR